MVLNFLHLFNRILKQKKLANYILYKQKSPVSRNRTFLFNGLFISIKVAQNYFSVHQMQTPPAFLFFDRR
jgi:hypothetical protein